MECEYTHLKHNLLMSHKKVVIRGMIIKGCNFKTMSSAFLWMKFTNLYLDCGWIIDGTMFQ
jgi:uncharacterized membrane protein (UPF0127 family)